MRRSVYGESMASLTPCHIQSITRNALTSIYIKPDHAPEHPVFHGGLSFAWFCFMRESDFLLRLS